MNKNQKTERLQLIDSQRISRNKLQSLAWLSKILKKKKTLKDWNEEAGPWRLWDE